MDKEQDSLEGKVALVTGGARRVGAAITRRLHAAGAKVLIHYRDSEADARGWKAS
jgi:pteridine reductase